MDDAFADPTSFVYPTACVVDPWPATLAASGCFADITHRTLIPGALRYTLRAPFWSAGASKERAIFLPDGGKIAFDPKEPWKLPEGTRIAKTFLLGDKPVETRILRLKNGKIEGADYEWNAAGDNATLNAESDKRTVEHANGITWFFPGRNDCVRCHTDAAGGFIGPETAQMNTRSDMFGKGAVNQIDALQRLGLFTDAVPKAASLARLDDPYAEALPLERRARAWLHVNCAYCHRPGSSGDAALDLRFTEPFAATHFCNEPTLQGTFGPDDTKLLAPGDHAKSNAYLRMTATGSGFGALMPPLSPAPGDARGIALVAAWIDALNGCPEAN